MLLWLPPSQDYHALVAHADRVEEQLRERIREPDVCVPFLQPGRLVRVRDLPSGGDFGWGCLVNMKDLKKDGQRVVLIDVLLKCALAEADGAAGAAGGAAPAPAESGDAENFSPRPCKPGDAGQMRVVAVTMPAVFALSAIRMYLPADLKRPENRNAVGKSIREVLRRFGDDVPMLDPVKDMKLADDAFGELLAQAKALRARVAAHAVHGADDRDARFGAFVRKAELRAKAKALRREARASQALVMRDELRRMKRVLRRLGHTDGDNVIQLKGRTACEVNTADELVVAELVFAGAFSSLDPAQVGAFALLFSRCEYCQFQRTPKCAQVVALLSCLVFTEKRKDEGYPRLQNPGLDAAYRQLVDAARVVGQAMADSKLDVDPEVGARAWIFCRGCGSDFFAVLRSTPKNSTPNSWACSRRGAAGRPSPR